MASCTNIYNVGTLQKYQYFNPVQWNPSKTDSIVTNDFVGCNEVSLAQGLVVDYAPPTIAASCDKA